MIASVTKINHCTGRELSWTMLQSSSDVNCQYCRKCSNLVPNLVTDNESRFPNEWKFIGWVMGALGFTEWALVPLFTVIWNGPGGFQWDLKLSSSDPDPSPISIS